MPHVQQYWSGELPEDLIPAALSCFQRLATVTYSFVRSCRSMGSWEWVDVQSVVSVLLVAMRAATEARSLAVAVARFVMASTVSFWYMCLAD